MKKWLTALLLSLLLLAAASTALAAEAADITGQCEFKTSGSAHTPVRMTNKKFTSYWESTKKVDPFVQVTSPDKETLIGGIYACFGNLPASWEVQVSSDGKKWETAAQGPQYLHAWVPLEEPARYVRLQVTTGKNYALRMNELYVLGVGEKPDWVQDWQPTCEKADIMFISTHPDDELIFFGGAIPTYAAEKKRDVVVAYYARNNSTRSSELLNSLWHMGVRTYPVIHTASDKMTRNLADSYKFASGSAKNVKAGQELVNGWMVALYRKYKPEVVVAQDIKGEYGHGLHMMTSDAAGNAIALAADAAQFPESSAVYGTWQVKKFYRHLWKENQIRMDWNVPLSSMGGATGLELADSAFILYHRTQDASGQSVVTTGTEYDNTLFGLVHSTVGEDVEKNDFLENIDLPEKAVEEAAAAAPAYEALLPELNERGFLDEGEFIYSSEAEGLWIFINQTCRIIIERKYDGAQPLTWFECDIHTDVEQGEMLRAIWNDDKKQYKKVRVDAAETAKKHKVVFATNTDYFTYRVDVNASGRNTGVVIRDGELLFDDPYPEKTATNPKYMPNLDMVAFMEDGALEVYRSHEITAKELLSRGAYDVYSFGPYLMKDGKLSEQVYKANDTKNPRCALGMVEPGHYVYVMVEGRLMDGSDSRSQGITMRELAKLMKAKGCENAINLDGGQTAVLVFMGKQLNKIGAYDGGKTNSRPTCEVMGVGYSEQVGTYEVK